MTDFDLVILDCGCSTAGCDCCVGVGVIIASADTGVGGSVELLSFPLSSGLREKSVSIAFHPKLMLLAVDFLELKPELLLLGWKRPVDILLFSLFSLFSTNASKPAEPIVAALSLFGFQVLDSGVGSGLSGIVS